MRKYFIDTLAGTLLGFVFFLLSAVLQGGIGFFGSSELFSLLPFLKDNLILFLLVYVFILSLLLFFVYFLTPFYKHRHGPGLSLKSYMFFALGVGLVYLLVWIVGFWAISKLSF